MSNSKLSLIMQEIEEYSRDGEIAMYNRIREIKNELSAAFIAKYDLQPDELVLVEVKYPNKSVFVLRSKREELKIVNERDEKPPQEIKESVEQNQLFEFVKKIATMETFSVANLWNLSQEARKMISK